MNPQVFILLGTNLGDRFANLLKAQHEIGRLVGKIVTQSSIYKTQAWGNTQQPDFFNQVIEINTSLSPEIALTTILSIEEGMGRIRYEKWGPRVIDIDILLWNNLIIETNQLTIPHPGIALRKFTLLPLNEIAASFMHPVIKKSVHQLLTECTDLLKVEKLEPEL